MELTIADLKPFLPGLEEALDDDTVSEVMVNQPGTVFVERAGRMTALEAPALTAEAVARAAIQIARPLGEDPATDPIIDARLADGSRVAVCSPPAAPTTAITIRRFGGRAFTVDELTASRSLPAAVVEQAAAALRAGRNVLISGGTGSGRGVTIRDLVRHALRHRPDHIVVGEVRGAEAADLLQTGTRREVVTAASGMPTWLERISVAADCRVRPGVVFRRLREARRPALPGGRFGKGRSRAAGASGACGRCG